MLSSDFVHIRPFVRLFVGPFDFGLIFSYINTILTEHFSLETLYSVTVDISISLRDQCTITLRFGEKPFVFVYDTNSSYYYYYYFPRCDHFSEKLVHLSTKTFMRLHSTWHWFPAGNFWYIFIGLYGVQAHFCIFRTFWYRRNSTGPILTCFEI